MNAIHCLLFGDNIDNAAGPRITSTRSASEATYESGSGCPIIPINCGCPSMSINTPVVGFPPTPRMEIWPAEPAATPKPVTPRSVTKSPGTRPFKTGSSADSSDSSMVVLFTTETDMGTLFLLTFVGVPVTTTSSILIVSDRLKLSWALVFKKNRTPRIDDVKKPVFIFILINLYARFILLFMCY
ncbi:MAG: hypothetical protein FD181_226 [Prolixibacteraceae bacterium]|nr:MAG: hypothetical protein FD181_226 [Prolixibacteraceae bacterium]